MKQMQTPGKMIPFRAIHGPFDGDTIPMPAHVIGMGKSMVLQDKKSPLGTLSKYYFNRLARTATFEGVVQIKPDERN